MGTRVSHAQAHLLPARPGQLSDSGLGTLLRRTQDGQVPEPRLSRTEFSLLLTVRATHFRASVRNGISSSNPPDRRWTREAGDFPLPFASRLQPVTGAAGRKAGVKAGRKPEPSKAAGSTNPAKHQREPRGYGNGYGTRFQKEVPGVCPIHTNQALEKKQPRTKHI